MWNPLTQNIVWQLHTKDLRRDMSAWTDDRLRDFERGFQSQDHNIARAYLVEVEREWRRRGVKLNLTKNSASCYNALS
jgi:hypothetical protein